MDITSFANFFFLSEAFRLKTAKKLNLTRKESGAYNIPILNKVFGKKDRLIYDIDLSANDFEDNSPLIEKINNFIFKHLPDFRINNIREYKNGIIFKNSDSEKKQGRRIGKILASFPDDVEAKTLLDAFKKDPIRSAKKKDYKVVISRHPYDIAGMSTDRAWTSCMNLGTPGVNYSDKSRRENSYYVKRDITEGSIVAYLISGEDKNKGGKYEITRPLSRILMKPFINNENRLDIVYSMGRIYNASISEFSDFIEKWLKENINLDTENKTYSLKNGLYPDGDRAVNFIIKDKKEDIAREEFFNELHYGNTTEKYNQFFEIVSQPDSLQAEINITFQIPENIKLTRFYYHKKTPKFIKDWLNMKGMLPINNFYSIQSYVEQRIVVVEYHVGDILNDLMHEYEDDKNDPVPYTTDEIAESWNDLFRGLNINSFDYKKVKRELLLILKDYEKSVADDETNEMKSFNAEMIDLFSNENPRFIYRYTKDEIQNVKSTTPNFIEDVKFFDKFDGVSLEEMVSIFNSEEYAAVEKSINTYMRSIKNISRDISRLISDKYLHLNLNGSLIFDQILKLLNIFDIINKYKHIFDESNNFARRQLFFNKDLSPKDKIPYLVLSQFFQKFKNLWKYI
jgi:hypothetical protein